MRGYRVVYDGSGPGGDEYNNLEDVILLFNREKAQGRAIVIWDRELKNILYPPSGKAADQNLDLVRSFLE